MTATLYDFYERELLFIRRMSQEFARQYPTVANRLLLEPDRSVDPHVERLIEAFALLTARIREKLDDEFPELTDGLLGILYPHYLAPIPSCSIVQFDLDPANAVPEGVVVPRHSRLHTQQIDGASCRFRTCYPTQLWPLRLVEARLQGPPFPPGLSPPTEAAAVIRLLWQTAGDLKFAGLQLDTLRLYLAGSPALNARLYELIFNRALRVEFRNPTTGEVVARLEPEQALRQVGFEADEGLLPYPPQAFLGYRLLTELFAFPAKFNFVDLAGWRQACAKTTGDRLETLIYLDVADADLERQIDTATFQLGCAPAVNLYEQLAEPISLTERRSEYAVVPDVHHPLETEVYSVDAVTSATPRGLRTFRPIYSVHHHSGWSPQETPDTYFNSLRRPSLTAGDQGTDVFLQLVDLDFEPRQPADAVLTVHTTCTNRDLPTRLRQVSGAPTLELEAAIPVRAVRCLTIPTAPLRPPLRRAAQWRLVSHLALNHLSLGDDEHGCAALQEMLRLYDFSTSDHGQQLAAVNRQLIDGITGLSSRRTVARIEGATASGFARGLEVTLEIDEAKYTGLGALLFGSVLERFFSLYASLNSFTRLVVRCKGRETPLKSWPPRAGEEPLL